MKIYVCVKQVPDTSGVVAVNPDGTMNRAKMPTIINPDDLNAMEAALQMKESEGATVVAVSMGPPQAGEMMRELLAMGADEAVLISGREFGGSDTFATSQIIAGGIHHMGIEKEDLVLCGRQAIDGDTAQVGPQIAEKLHLLQVTYATEIKKDGDTYTVKRALEDGYMTIQVKSPCLITCIKELNEPRYMSVEGVFEADEKPLTILDYEALKDEPLIETDTIGLNGSPTNIFRSFNPPVKGQGEMLQGTEKEMAAALAEKLSTKHVI